MLYNPYANKVYNFKASEIEIYLVKWNKNENFNI